VSRYAARAGRSWVWCPSRSNVPQTHEPGAETEVDFERGPRCSPTHGWSPRSWTGSPSTHTFWKRNRVLPTPGQHDHRSTQGRLTQLPGRSRPTLGAADDEVVDIDLLVVPHCPNEAPAAALLRSALNQSGLLTQGFQITVVGDEHEAAARGFTGSPTFLINGTDPFGDSTQATGLTCRLYRQPNGPPSGLPGLNDLRDALVTAVRENHPRG